MSSLNDDDDDNNREYTKFTKTMRVPPRLVSSTSDPRPCHLCMA
jgi:hypothetical protein